MIRGELTNLRAVERGDAPALHDLLNDEGTRLGWGMVGDVRSLARVQAEIEGWIADEVQQGLPAVWIIETLEGLFAGVILIRPSRPTDRTIELSLAVAPTVRRRGVARDALTTLLEVAFDEWNVVRVQLRCEAGNTAAVALYRAMGLVHEGTLRDATYTGGAFADQLLYARIRSDSP